MSSAISAPAPQRFPLGAMMILAHFALFTYIAPFIRDAGLPDYAISLSLTVLGGSLPVALALMTVWAPACEQSASTTSRPSCGPAAKTRTQPTGSQS